MYSVTIQKERFTHDEELQKLISQTSGVGAVSSFVGFVRENDHDKKLKSLYLEHYPGLVEKEIWRIVEKAKERWAIKGCRIIHRVGEILVNEPIVLVITLSKHREHAFAATEYIMDYLKTEAPFWKKEIFFDQKECWVEVNTNDYLRKQKWDV